MVNGVIEAITVRTPVSITLDSSFESWDDVCVWGDEIPEDQDFRFVARLPMNSLGECHCVALEGCGFRVSDDEAYTYLDSDGKDFLWHGSDAIDTLAEAEQASPGSDAFRWEVLGAVTRRREMNWGALLGCVLRNLPESVPHLDVVAGWRSLPGTKPKQRVFANIALRLEREGVCCVDVEDTWLGAVIAEAGCNESTVISVETRGIGMR